MTGRVLVIDDSADIHKLLAVRLKPEELELHRADCGEAGLAQAMSCPPDLILLDVDMPGMTGFEVCARLKGNPGTAPIPIIFLTGADDVEAKVRGFDLGAVDYVTKPFEPNELRARVRAALRTKHLQDMLATRAQIDALTGLRNRAYFDARLADELAAANRYGRHVALVMLDLDHFKQINDTHGHPFGDAVLQLTAELLTSNIRAADAACRYGGEEFALILSETGLAGGEKVAERIRLAIRANPFRFGNKSTGVTASLGVSATDRLGPRVRVEPATLLIAADQALYAAKRGGRDTIRGSQLRLAA